MSDSHWKLKDFVECHAPVSFGSWKWSRHVGIFVSKLGVDIADLRS